jgi:hypothetical protein
MSDKELLFQAANTFTKNLVSNLFGINTIGTDALITYVVNNMEDECIWNHSLIRVVI